MATNQIRWVGNVDGGGPMRRKGKFKAGASQAIKKGEMLELDGSSDFVPLASDKSLTAELAISDCEILTGDLAGYYDVIVPRPGDLFAFPLSAAGTPALGAALYWASSQSLAESGSNAIANVASDDHIPSQGFKSRDGSPDAGTTLRSVTEVLVTVKAAVSYYAAIQT